MNPTIKYPLTYGLLSGLVVIVVLIAGITLADRVSLFGTMWFGYLVMLVALSFIFVGTKRFRDVERGGVIRFGGAFAMGLGIAVVASTIYMLVWEVYLALTHYAFMDQYVAAAIRAKQASGLSGAALARQVAELEQMRVQYRNPLYRLPMTFMEIFPVGFVISLIAAALLRNPRFMPAR